MQYFTRGVCCRIIQFETDGRKLCSVRFDGGCKGNHSGIAALVEGRDIDEVIRLLEGIQCRNGTSCPDQLAQALKEYKAQKLD